MLGRSTPLMAADTVISAVLTCTANRGQMGTTLPTAAYTRRGMSAQQALGHHSAVLRRPVARPVYDPLTPRAPCPLQTVITEVWELVDQFYLDVRNTGFDHGRWEQLRDGTLAQQYHDQAQLYGAVREMLARGVADPYSRLITPGEFASMKKYDITGGARARLGGCEARWSALHGCCCKGAVYQHLVCWFGL
jgi:hypothetical protein